MNVFEIVTDRIIKQLEAGTIPWRKTWSGSQEAVNWKTGKAYNGINRLLLGRGGEYATFKQITESGGKVKKGAVSDIVVFWKWIEKADEEGNVGKFPLLRYYNVFEINSQCEGLTSKNVITEYPNTPIERCDQIIKGYFNPPEIRHEEQRAFYKPFFDYVNMPKFNSFISSEEYYGTLFHELIHSTGHESRLKRFEKEKSKHHFGSNNYAKEELVAEMGASFLCSIAGIDNVTLENSAAYIQNWLEVLKNDKKLIVMAASAAEKAVKHIIGDSFAGNEE